MLFMRLKLSALILLPVLIMKVIPANAQEQRFAIGLRYGYSLPMGQFASHEYKRDGKEYGAYALLGSAFSAEGTGYVIDRLGIAANISVAYYPIATGYYLEDKDADDPAGMNFRMKSDPYEVWKFMAGVLYKLPIREKISFTLKGMSGILWAKTPDQLYAANYFGIGEYVWMKTQARSTVISILGGMACNYQLFPNVELNLCSEFSYAKPTFSFWDAKLTVKTDREIRMPILKVQPGLTITF